MAASWMWLVLMLHIPAAVAEAQVAQDGIAEAVLGSSGKVSITMQKKGSIIRRHDGLTEQEEMLAELEGQGRQLYGVRDDADRTQKVLSGTAYKADPGGTRIPDPWAVHIGPHGGSHSLAYPHSQKGVHRSSYTAPDWAPHARMPTMPECSGDVTQEMGLSDYGSISHGCSACSRDCTEENKQQATNLTWHFEPPLEDCNAFDVKLYANWSSIDQLGCTDCEAKGIRHAFEMTFATNAGEGSPGYEDKALGFEGWMGPEVLGGPRSSGSDFHGLHVFEIEDTEEPSRSENCDAHNPPGRWLAIPGELRAGETFHCERVCKSSHPCNCGRNTHMRCTAAIAMSSKQVFAYRIRKVAESSTGTLAGNSYVGTEWEVTAEDLTQASPVMTVGRVVLAGNSAIYGIKKLGQSHQHIGCVPCDLFYESTIVSGPFIEEPVGVHAVRSANGMPPPLSSESCELFRISSMAGLSVRFETGPGLWPPFEVNDTIFSCQHTGANTCPV